VWVHSYIGLHYWLRPATGYARAKIVLFAIAVANPLLALAGFMVAGRELAQTLSQGDVWSDLLERMRWPSESALTRLAHAIDWSQWTFLSLLAAISGAHMVRLVRVAARPKFDTAYVGGPTIRIQAGATLLEISRMHGVPHTSVCGGSGRCSTCRVRIEGGGDGLPPPTGA
jgi:adenylate cyclase